MWSNIITLCRFENFFIIKIFCYANRMGNCKISNIGRIRIHIRIQNTNMYWTNFQCSHHMMWFGSLLLGNPQLGYQQFLIRLKFDQENQDYVLKVLTQNQIRFFIYFRPNSDVSVTVALYVTCYFFINFRVFIISCFRLWWLSSLLDTYLRSHRLQWYDVGSCWALMWFIRWP